MRTIPLFFLTACLGLDQKDLSGTIDTEDTSSGLPGDDGDPTEDSDPGPIDDSGGGNFDENEAPVALAGDDLAVEAGTVVTLDGSASYDPDDDYLTYAWALTLLPSGSTASLINEDREDPQIYVDIEGEYEIELTVSDGVLESSDSLTISVTQPNEEPVAVAGVDQTVNVGDSVILDGTSSYDPNGDAVTFSWTMTAVPSGSFATLSDTTSPSPRFTADVAGTYEIQLVVNDGEFDSNPDSVRVSTLNTGGGGGGGGGGGSSSSCLSCSEPTRQYLLRKRSLTGLASGPGLVFMPIGALLWWRKRARS